jgi:hypothetical protein
MNGCLDFTGRIQVKKTVFGIFSVVRSAIQKGTEATIFPQQQVSWRQQGTKYWSWNIYVTHQAQLSPSAGLVKLSLTCKALAITF